MDGNEDLFARLMLTEPTIAKLTEDAVAAALSSMSITPRREQRKSKRLTNLRAAPRCLARTRRGTPCQCPAIRSKVRCHLHGGSMRSGAPKGERNGAFTNGGWTAEAIELRAKAHKLWSVLRLSS